MCEHVRIFWKIGAQINLHFNISMHTNFHPCIFDTLRAICDRNRNDVLSHSGEGGVGKLYQCDLRPNYTLSHAGESIMFNA